MILLLFIIPALAGLAAFALRSPAVRRGLLIGTALVHAALTAICWQTTPSPALGGWLALDAAGLLFLSITSGLFLVASFYAAGYLGQQANKHITDAEEGMLFDNAPEAVFIGCLLLFLATMTLVTVSQHFGLLWVAVEATTLASAPLIYFHRHHRSLEATWKYLLICSVGIALALLANFFLGVAVTQSTGGGFPMVLSELVTHARGLQTPWLKAAGLLFFYWIYRLGLTASGIKMCVLSALLIGLAFSDLEERILPDEMTLGGVAMGLAFAWFVTVNDFSGQAILWLIGISPAGKFRSLAEAAVGAALPAFFLWAGGWLYEKIRHREGLGLGDVKLIAMVGAVLGLHAALLTLILGSIAGSVVGLAYIKFTHKDASTYELPFGTFLSLAALVAAFGWGLA